MTVTVEYSDPKNKGNKWVKIIKKNQCALCPSTWGLSKHHLFGKSDKFTAVVCLNCHAMMHAEIENGIVGPFSRHMIAMMAKLFPVEQKLPEWEHPRDELIKEHKRLCHEFPLAAPHLPAPPPYESPLANVILTSGVL